MNVFHKNPGALPEHLPEISAACFDCRRISSLWKAYREFGYSDLTKAETQEAYEIAIVREVTAEDGIIAMLTRRQLVEAGVVEESTDA